MCWDFLSFVIWLAKSMRAVSLPFHWQSSLIGRSLCWEQALEDIQIFTDTYVSISGIIWHTSSLIICNVNAGHSLVSILISRFVLNLRDDGVSQNGSHFSLYMSQTDIRFASGEEPTNAGRFIWVTDGTICGESNHGSMRDGQEIRNVWYTLYCAVAWQVHYFSRWYTM